MLKRIVVGLNGSDFSSAAGSLAIEWAKRHSASVVGVGVVDTALVIPAEPTPIGGAAFKRERDAAVLATARKANVDCLSTFGRSCAIAGVDWTIVEREGDADEVLTRETQRGDLLILGRKRSSEESVTAPLSNTLHAVLKKSSRPVLCVPSGSTSSGAVVVAFDGSFAASRALFSFASLGLFTSVPIHVVAVEETSGQHAESLAHAKEFLLAHGYQVDVKVIPVMSDVADTLIQHVTALSPQLVVMGSLGKSWIQELLFGSVTKKLLESTSVPILFGH